MSNFSRTYKHKTDKDHPLKKVIFWGKGRYYEMGICDASKAHEYRTVNFISEKEFDKWVKDFEGVNEKK